MLHVGGVQSHSLYSPLGNEEAQQFYIFVKKYVLETK